MLVPLQLGQLVILTTKHSSPLWRNYAASFALFTNLPLHEVPIPNEPAVAVGDDEPTSDVFRDRWLPFVLKSNRWPVLILRPGSTRTVRPERTPDDLMSLVYDMKLTAAHRTRPIVIRDSDRATIGYLVHTREQALDFVDEVDAQEFSTRLRINTPDPRVQVVSPVETLHQARPITYYEVTRFANPRYLEPQPTDDTSDVAHIRAILNSVRTPYVLTLDPTSKVTARIPIPERLGNEILLFSSLNPYNGIVSTHGAPVLYPTSLGDVSLQSQPKDADFLTLVTSVSRVPIRIVPDVVTVISYAPETAKGRSHGIVTAYKEAYRLSRIVQRHPPFDNYADLMQDKGRSLPGHGPIDLISKTLHDWLDDSRYAKTFKYQRIAAELGHTHAKRSEPTAIHSARWLSHIIEQVNTGAA